MQRLAESQNVNGYERRTDAIMVHVTQETVS
jgi:hypothetical protein